MGLRFSSISAMTCQPREASLCAKNRMVSFESLLPGMTMWKSMTGEVSDPRLVTWKSYPSARS